MKYLIAALSLCFFSIINFIYLTKHHFEVRMGLSGGQSLCNVSATFNCDTAAASAFSVFLGIPVAVWGLAAHLLLLIFLLIAFLGLNQNKERVLRYCFYLASSFAFVSIFMGSISLFQLKSFCPFCLVSYLLAFATCFVIFQTSEELSFASFTEDLKDLTGAHKWVLVAGVATLPTTWLMSSILNEQFGIEKLRPYIAENVSQWRNNPIQTFDESLGLSTSKEPAEFTIVEFADFKCPHCKLAAPTLHAFQKTRKNVKVIFKPFPLDGLCNSEIERATDEMRCVFPAAVFCAEDQSSKGWELFDWIFDNQERWFAPLDKQSVIQEMAQQMGIDAGKFDECIKSEAVLNRVKANAAEGAQAKIQGTPSIFVNGKLLQRGQFLPVLEEAYKTLQAQ
jgi:protein-disulfide isomerase